MEIEYDTQSKLIGEATAFVKAFYSLTGAHMGIHDIRDDIVIPSGLTRNNLCSYCTKKCQEFYDTCHCDDMEGLDRAILTKQITVFRCHLGATSCIIPIVENGVTIGVIDFGMFFIQPDPSLTFDAIFHRLTARYPDAFAEDCREEMLEAYNNTCSMSEEQFRCYITLVRCAARGMYLNTLFSAGDNTPTSRLRNYTRLLQPERIPLSSFSVASVAEELNFSQAHLARLSNEVFGMPLKQHILQMKIDYAKKLLLKEPNLSVRDIAQKVGIDNPHYLSRIFRQKTGYTCQEYRSVMTAQKKGSPE